jgi:hypothetical protein
MVTFWLLEAHKTEMIVFVLIAIVCYAFAAAVFSINNIYMKTGTCPGFLP